MVSAPADHEDEREGNEPCACGAVHEWADSWEKCGPILIHRMGEQYAVSHAPSRMGGCFEVDPKKGA